MRSVEDKGCYNVGAAAGHEISSSSTAAAISFEFHKGNNGTKNHGSSGSHHHRTALGKPTPSKWDDAQKWVVGLSRGRRRDKTPSETKPRNSNADDRRLISPPVPQKEQEYYYNSSSGEDGGGGEEANGETKRVDCEEYSIWRINNKKPAENSTTSVVRSICLRDMGTEMTPIASQEPSRTATPIRATSPAARSPISSGSSTPIRFNNAEKYPAPETEGGKGGDQTTNAAAGAGAENNNSDEARKQNNNLETRAMAWDEAERAKYMARYKREEVKIQAWENHEKRKAEMEMKKMEVKAERLKARAKERCSNKLAATRRIAEEKRANAESELNEKAMRTSESADYIRRTGHLPSSFSFKLPSLCW